MAVRRPSVWPAAVWVWMFGAYAYGMTTVCAAWYARDAAEGSLSVLRSLLWQGAVYGLWFPVIGLVWLVLRRAGAGVRAYGALMALAIVVTPVMSLASSLIDQSFRGGAGWDQLAGWSLARGPVVILIYTAIVAAGFAAVHRSRAVEARAEAARMGEALAAARQAAQHVADDPERPERLMVMLGKRRAPVSVAEIEWLSAAGNYVVVNWGGREGLVRQTLQALEQALDPALFARSHRSIIVNLAQVRDAHPLSDGSWRLTMRSGAELVASRTYRDAVLARLKR